MTNTLGVAVMRVQVAELHEGHRHLIDTLLDENDYVLILVGDRIKVDGKRNPLPFVVRKQMIEALYGDRLIVRRLPDNPSDQAWSAGLDATIEAFNQSALATLYCSRDGFAEHYHGKHPLRILDEHPAESGTEQRSRIAEEAQQGGPNSPLYRAGWIAAATIRPAIDFSTVDVAVINDDRTHILLGQKSIDGDRWRFPGGFVDPTDESRWAAAKREVREECGDIEIEVEAHLGDFKIDDFRYRDEADSIRTDLFVANYVFGAIRAKDDLSDLRWFPVNELTNRLIDNHQPLGAAVLEHLKKGTTS
ncbi:MAG: NUDIX domain-containing protein [Patescibacteria group bacterium]